MPSLRSTWRRLAARLVHAVWRWLQQAGTVTGETTAGRRFAAFGPGSLIAFPTGSIYGERWIQLGAGTMIGEYASICAGLAPGHDLGPDPVMRIGDRCVIGRGSHIVAHQSIDIGDDVFTGPYVYITDQNHSYADPDLPIGRQWPVNAPVRIGAGTWLGTGAIVLPGSVIGRNVVVAAGAVVRGVIGDRCVVAGVPARIVKDFEPETGWTRPAGDDVGPRSGSVPPGMAPAELAPPGMAPAELAPPGMAPVELAPPGVVPPGLTPSGVGAADAALASATLAENGAPEAITRVAALAEPILADPILTEPVLVETDLTATAPAEPIASDQSLARPLLAEQDS